MSKSKRRDTNGIIEILNEEKDKMLNSSPSSKRKERTCRREGELQRLGFLVFRERRCHFSLRSRAIRPSEFFGARRKVVLRGEGNVWAPVLRSFDKIREVGVLSYLKLHFI